MFWTWCTSSSFQIIVGTMGLTGNFIAIPILLSKRMTSIFNRMLVFLSVFDNIFIACSLLESVRKNFGPWNEKIQTYAFAYFLYQLQSVAAVSSIFTTIVLALERCLAVAKPIEYHNAVQVKLIIFYWPSHYSGLLMWQSAQLRLFLIAPKCVLLRPYLHSFLAYFGLLMHNLGYFWSSQFLSYGGPTSFSTKLKTDPWKKMMNDFVEQNFVNVWICYYISKAPTVFLSLIWKKQIKFDHNWQ